MLARPLKVYFLTTMNAGTAYYRQWLFKQEMNRQKIADAVIPWFNFDTVNMQPWQFEVGDSYVSGNQGLINHMVSKSDVIVAQYVHDWKAIALLEALKMAYPDKPLVLEIDDNILETPTWNAAFEQFQPGFMFRDIILEQMRISDAIITTTPYLKDLYSEFNKHIYIVPNCIDVPLWDRAYEKRKPHKGEVRIGWMGGASHDEDLRTIEEPLKALLKRRQNVWFYCVHGAPAFFKDQSRIVTPRKFERMDNYPRAMVKHGFDIGIAPLVDCGFNRGKSNLRKVEYGGLRIPVVAANVGHFAQTVKHGRDGFLYEAADPKLRAEQFVKALEVLIDNPKVREAMGQYNYLDVKKNFNVEHVAREYVGVLQEIQERGQVVDIEPVRETPWSSQQQEPMPSSR